MVPYLAFFAAGDFTIAQGVRRGLPWLVAVSQALGQADEAASMRLMRKTPAVISGLEKDLGDYPFSVVGASPPRSTWASRWRTRRRPVHLAGVRRQRARPRSLAVHALAHQWFGDDGRGRAGGGDIWLNEGFATFIGVDAGPRHARRSTTGAAIVRALLRQPSMRANGLLDGCRSATGARSKVASTPRSTDRGVRWLAQALRNRVGNRDFWRILRSWIREQQGGNGSTEEFEALAARVWSRAASAADEGSALMRAQSRHAPQPGGRPPPRSPRGPSWDCRPVRCWLRGAERLVDRMLP